MFVGFRLRVLSVDGFSCGWKVSYLHCRLSGPSNVGESPPVRRSEYGRGGYSGCSILSSFRFSGRLIAFEGREWQTWLYLIREGKSIFAEVSEDVVGCMQN